VPRADLVAKLEPSSHPRVAAPALADDRPRLQTALSGAFRFVWRTLRGLGVSDERVDDAAQQVFLVFARRIAEVPPSKERAFLAQTAIRVAANDRRSERRRREAPGGALDQHQSPGQDPERCLEQKQRLQLLDRVLDGLPPPERAVFVLFEIEGLSTPEIANLLEIPRGTVVSRLRRARATFSEQAGHLSSHLADGASR